ncbi:MAG: hypothetical protein ABRQ37_05890 [Candidatus Eremiobacterota bacterium]
MNNHYGENMVSKNHIFLLIALVFVLMVTVGLMTSKDQAYDDIIAVQKVEIEILQKEIETMAPVKMQIELYREETRSMKEEIETLKKKGKL